MSESTPTRGGATAPRGFLTGAAAADIKGKGSPRPDVALLVSERPAVAAGVFTTNRVRASCVAVSKLRVESGPLRAIVVNSGNANACTGPQGHADTLRMCELAALAIDLPVDSLAVASTGVIGVQLPMDRIAAGIRLAASTLSPQRHGDAARAIMTTDTFPKEASVRVLLPSGTEVVLGAMAKGSGMIHPQMATMLGFVTTDAAISRDALQPALREAVNASFNMISVDGDTSTNDMVLAMANGLAGNAEIGVGTPDHAAFSDALRGVLVDLAKAIARDGEGATRLMEVVVNGAPSLSDARMAARSVVSSSLVKAAVFGEDANWGRILAAIGYSGAAFDPERVDLYLGEVKVLEAGTGLVFDEDAARRILRRPVLTIRAELHAGADTATAWGCDLSYDYVKINAEYRT